MNKEIPNDFLLKEVLSATGWNLPKSYNDDTIITKEKIIGVEVKELNISIRELRYMLEQNSHILYLISKGWYDKSA